MPWKHAPEASLQNFHRSQQSVAVKNGTSRAGAEKSYACVIFDRTYLSFQREIWLARILQSISERFYNWI